MFILPFSAFMLSKQGLINIENLSAPSCPNAIRKLTKLILLLCLVPSKVHIFLRQKQQPTFANLGKKAAFWTKFSRLEDKAQGSSAKQKLRLSAPGMVVL